MTPEEPRLTPSQLAYVLRMVESGLVRVLPTIHGVAVTEAMRALYGTDLMGDMNMEEQCQDQSSKTTQTR